MNKKISVGLIGMGRMGLIYAEDLSYRVANVRLTAVSDVNPAAEEKAGELGIPKWYPDYHDMLADRFIDAVIIVTPTHTHREIVIAAAEHGKAIFCEKPLAISLDEGLEMQQAIAENGVFFHMGLMRRFDRSYRAAKEKIEEGVIGRPVVFKASTRDPFRPSLEYLDPRHSGGIILDMGIHDIDLAHWLIGGISQVYTTGGILAYPEVSEVGDLDNAIITLNFKSGALGVIDLTRRGVYGYDIRTEILGTEGAVQIGYLRETPLRVMTEEGVMHDAVPYFTQRFEQAYIDQLRNFVEHLMLDKEPSINCADGIAGLEVALAAVQSYKEKRPVTLS